MICASRDLPIIMSIVFSTFAIKGVAISGMVYVPIPACITNMLDMYMRRVLVEEGRCT